MEWTHCIRALVSLAWGSPQTTIWPEQKSHPVSEREKLGPRSARTSPSFLHPPSVPQKGKDPPQPPGGFIRFNAWQTETRKPHTDIHTQECTQAAMPYVALAIQTWGEGIWKTGWYTTYQEAQNSYIHAQQMPKVSGCHTYKYTQTYLHTYALTSIQRQT